ncbi:MAG: GntG family PLP-dependent aldolase [Crocinitomicaceae bacterium]
MKIDLRSDTVTQPSQEMREAMFNAPVGDDVFMEDPTVNELEQYAANLFGMEAGLYCSSGTQTNQIAINVHCAPGTEVICHEEAHIYKYEGGGIAKNSGASVRLLKGNRGRLSLDDIKQWVNNPSDIHLPLTALVSLEDTMNRGGGSVYDFNEIKAIRLWCLEQKLPLHLDGARVFNALAENGISPKEYGAQFDSISICLSKGLGAPVGSVLIGSAEFIHKARRVRKVFGGGMRQAGIIAAGGLYALKNNVNRLKEDHAHAKQLATCLEKLNWVEKVLPVETNIVVICIKDAAKQSYILEKLKEKDILAVGFGNGMIRMVTHLDITPEKVQTCIQLLQTVEI